MQRSQHKRVARAKKRDKLTEKRHARREVARILKTVEVEA